MYSMYIGDVIGILLGIRFGCLVVPSMFVTCQALAIGWVSGWS